MGSPYRDAPARIPDQLRDDPGPKSLARFDVSGAPGARGSHGAHGFHGAAPGASGGPGGNAGPAEPGQDAGSIELSLATTDIDNVIEVEAELVDPDGVRDRSETVHTIGPGGFIELFAVGGVGGEGGDGGSGGAGAAGRDGSDATSWSSGGDGGPGGHGGHGGDGSSGAPGGSGGRVVVRADAGSTQLFMLVRHAVDGGEGGAPGRNGRGGSGGPGGSGGSSYSWTETERYTDAQGNTQTRTIHHSNPGGSDGPPGRRGADGNARLTAGAPGGDGEVIYAVRDGDRVAEYTSRYQLRLVSMAHASSNNDLVYEPGEAITVSDLVVENTGGMPTPAAADICVALEKRGWIDADESASLIVPRGLAPGQRVTLDGELIFRIDELRPRESSAPLEVEETVGAFAEVVSVRRRFEGFQSGEALAAGEIVIRFPARLAAITSLHSLAPGERSRMRWSVTNQSRLALGRRSEGRRRLQIRLTAPESELGDAEIALYDETGAEVAPSAGLIREIDRLEPGETWELEIAIGIKAGAPAYRAFTTRVALELGGIEDPERVRAIQLRDFCTRVAKNYRRDPSADLLLVVNHRTTAEGLAAWEELAGLFGFTLNLWDLSLEGHLDLIASKLIDDFAGGTIAVLDNAIETAAGEARPHEFLSKADVHAANSAGIHIAFIGGDPDLDRLLLPEGETAGEAVAVRERQWWGGMPELADLGEEAAEIQKELIAAYPDRRYVVVYDFDPEIESKFLWIKNWRVGEIEVKTTIDPVAGSVTHAAIADFELHDPEHILGDAIADAMLLARGFDANLARLSELLAGGSPEVDRLAPLIAGAMLAELANEQDAICSSRWREGLSRDEIRDKLPRLRSLASARIGGGDLLPASREAGHVIELAARLRYFAASQVKLWERLPPIRFLRRAPSVAGIVGELVEELLASTFGDRAGDAGELLDRKIDALEEQGLGGDYHARSLVYGATAPETITTDDELSADPAARILSREQVEALDARDRRHDARRAQLSELARAAGRDLLIT